MRRFDGTSLSQENRLKTRRVPPACPEPVEGSGARCVGLHFDKTHKEMWTTVSPILSFGEKSVLTPTAFRKNSAKSVL